MSNNHVELKNGNIVSTTNIKTKHREVFTSSGTWVNPGVTKVRAIIVGAGAAGGLTGKYGGGGSGQVKDIVVPSFTGDITVTVGQPVTNTDGQSSSILFNSTTIIALGGITPTSTGVGGAGGNGGGGGSSGTSGAGGSYYGNDGVAGDGPYAGGVAYDSGSCVSGFVGGAGNVGGGNPVGGGGGAGFGGNGGNGGGVGDNGQDGQGWGAGGGGASLNQTPGQGYQGIVIIEWES